MEAQTAISFLAGLIGAGVGAYVVSYFKVSAKITAQTNQIKEILEQKYLIKSKEESAKIDAVTNRLDEILKQQKAITSTNEAAKIDILTAKMDQVVEQQKNITTTTETIKSNVDIDNWRKKENQTLLKEKIEHIFKLLGQFQLAWGPYLTPNEHKNRNGMIEESQSFFAIKIDIEMNSLLYFSEDEVKPYLFEFEEMTKEIIRIKQEYTHKGFLPPEEEADRLTEMSISFINRYRRFLIKKMSDVLNQ